MNTVRKIPQRQCVGCHEMHNKKEMVRVLKVEDGTFVIDATGKKNGRGAYLCHNASCLEAAISSRGLERSFKQAIPSEVYEQLKRSFEEIETE